MKILVIAPHMDDEVLGCGGVIARHVAVGDDVSVCFIAHRVYNHRFSRKKNDTEKSHARKAKAILEYKESVFFGLSDERLDVCVQDIIIPLERYIFKKRPEIVYCPFAEDNNQDHRSVFNATRVALRPLATPFVKKVLAYEVLSSTEQSPPLYKCAFLPNYYVDIKKYIKNKIDAFKCYETEKRDYPHPRSLEAIKVLAQMRGIEIGLEYAEAFMILREKRDR